MERLSKPAQAGLVGEEGEAAFLEDRAAPEPKVFNQREDSPPYMVRDTGWPRRRMKLEYSTPHTKSTQKGLRT